ncbi:MAG: glycoside hydrolase [Prevotella sp.]|nr:glycoside hydrolase [Prevotella sp.]
MRHFRILTLTVLLGLALSSGAQQTFTHYARTGLKTTLQINWTARNYGSIQWQRSSDQGRTWTDIAGATAREYSFLPSADSYLRVVVSGDEACKPITQTHIVKTSSFSVDLVETSATTATYQISNFSVPRSEITEWGFCHNYYNLSRTYQNMYREKIGTELPDGDTFELVCPHLSPNEKYSVRVYFKTKDGSVLYGPSKITETLPGLEWSSEDWTITKNTVIAKFRLDGYTGTAPDITFLFGTQGDMKPYTVSRDGSWLYTSQAVRGLQPGKEYIATVTADLGGDVQTITKSVRTMTDYSSFEIDKSVTPASHRIEWNRQNRIQLSPDNIQAEYPRLQRVSNDTILLTYHGGDGTAVNTDHWQDIYLQRSTDDGQTWSVPEKLMDHSKRFSNDAYGWYRFADPTFTRLHNGWLLMQFIGNANPETNHNCQVFVSISKDNGNTWGDPITVGRGRTWEPQIVQLPGGELELLVSSEAYWWDSQRDNLFQEILCSRSTDNGETWTAFTRASYHAGCRDGMPVPVLLQGNKGILYTIESINSNDNPSLILRDLDGEWEANEWTGTQTSHRWVAEPIRGACAPYMIQLPTGEIVICGHADQKGSVWQTNRTKVVIGDNTGHNFGSRTLPFSSLPTGEGAYYSSLFLKDSQTVWLAISHSVYDGNDCKKNTVEYIEGKIIEK